MSNQTQSENITQILNNIVSNLFVQTSSEKSIIINLLILTGLVIGSYLLSSLLMRVINNRIKNKQRNSFLFNIVFNQKVLLNLSRLLPWLVLQVGITFVPYLNDSLATILRNVATALTVLFTMNAIVAFINAIIEHYTKNEKSSIQAYKVVLQLLKMVIYILGIIIIISSLVDRSPMILLSSFGAMSAVSMLIFQDTIKSFVAGIQISTNDLIRIGDWIEMPQFGADGSVIDISLHTVKVENFDKTIITIPAWRIVTESFKNWRGMFESGGRRIKRSIYIDMSCVRFMNEEDLKRLAHVNVLADYLHDKQVEINQYNDNLGENAKMDANRRRLTNIGTFRAYATEYLRLHPKIHKGYYLMVRQQQPDSKGLPLEIYCFTNTTVWVEYESIQDDIFDHLYSVMPEFGLRPFQSLSGFDLTKFTESK